MVEDVEMVLLALEISGIKTLNKNLNLGSFGQALI